MKEDCPKEYYQLNITESDLMDWLICNGATDKEATRWIHKRNKVFGNKSPYQLIKQGKTQPLLDMIGQLEYGVYS